jgi:hypothetical protein
MSSAVDFNTPAVVKEARAWLADTGLPKARIRKMDDDKVQRTVSRVYDGGMPAFLASVTELAAA